MNWCESQVRAECCGGKLPPANLLVDYVFGLGKNSRLINMTLETQQKARACYEQQKQTVVSFLEKLFHPDEEFNDETENLINSSVWYRSLNYKTEKSWSRFRRVVSKVEYSPSGINVRFVVTSVANDKVSPSELYTQKYCPRGEMENRFKEQQLELFSDRTSTHTFEGNQLRLWFSSLAYVLMQALREHCLATTELAQSQVGTIRTKILKLGARVLISVRRVLVSLQQWLSLSRSFCDCLQLPGESAQSRLSITNF